MEEVVQACIVFGHQVMIHQSLKVGCIWKTSFRKFGHMYIASYIFLCCRYRLRPKMLRDVSNISMRTTILGNEIDFPVGVAPTALQRMAHDKGELATARG